MGQAAIGDGVAGVELEGAAEMHQRLVEAILLVERDGQVEMRPEGIGFMFQPLTKLGDRLVQLALRGQQCPQTGVGPGIDRVLLGPLKIGDCLVASTLPNQRVGQGRFGLGIGGGTCQVVPPQCFVVAPKRRLPGGTGHQNGNHQPGAGAQRPRPGERTGGQPRGPPGQCDGEPDAGQIHVTIGHRVIGDRNQPQYRNQHAQIPVPADKQVRTPAPPDHRGRAHGGQDRQGAGHFPGRRTVGRIGIKRGQVGGIEKLHDVVDGGNRRVADPHRPGGRRVSMAVSPERHQTIAQRQGKQRQLFQHQPHRAGPSKRDGPRRSVAGRTEAGQRPEIEQQKQRRQRDEHRLGHQAEGEKRRHEQISRERPAVPHVAQPGREREHEKQSAQHVAPFGYPGHALDVLRMSGEDRGHEAAGPQLAGHPPQHEKQGDRRGGVKQQIGEMMSPGVQSKQLDVEHVRQRGQRIPLAVGPLGKGPADGLGGQPLGDVAVFVDKTVVIVIQQDVTERLAIDQPDRREQQPAHAPSIPGVGSLPRIVGRTDWFCWIHGFSSSALSRVNWSRLRRAVELLGSISKAWR